MGAEGPCHRHDHQPHRAGDDNDHHHGGGGGQITSIIKRTMIRERESATNTGRSQAARSLA